jgi:hypothetical protein
MVKKATSGETRGRLIVKIYPVGRDDLAPLEAPERFAMEIVYFMTPQDAKSEHPIGPGEYWIDRKDIDRWLEDGCFRIVSPLDAQVQAEIELTEFQEQWLEWMQQHQIEQVRLVRQ